MEEGNLTPHILIAELNRILKSLPIQKKMKKGAESFAHPDAARTIAEEIIKIALRHETK